MAKQKIEHYTVCSRCGTESGLLSLLTRCRDGKSHIFVGQRTRWVNE